jgi:hypothetical protein
MWGLALRNEQMDGRREWRVRSMVAACGGFKVGWYLKYASLELMLY